LTLKVLAQNGYRYQPARHSVWFDSLETCMSSTAIVIGGNVRTIRHAMDRRQLHSGSPRFETRKNIRHGFLEPAKRTQPTAKPASPE